ncbi:MAG: hypothetical protein LQ345_000841 [Seirophora villosa]|nr:MAG: hypothetical protein LQ345_000841 [Seirophora villosa]
MAPYFGLTGGWLTFWVSVACSTDMTLFGYDQGVFGGVVVTQDYLDTLELNGEGRTSLLGTVTAIYDVGCFFGAIAAFSLGEILGRKKTILLGTTIMSIGAILQITAFGVPQMIVGRIIAGIGNGLNTATAPVWQAETSKAAWRGKLVVVEMILNIAGFSLSNWVTYGFSFVGGGISWRMPLVLQFIFIVMLFATVPWLPESPRWLIAHGYIEQAEQIIADLEATTVDDPWVVTESKGINVTSYYLPTVLTQSVGLENSLARLLAACNSVSYLLFSLIGIPNRQQTSCLGVNRFLLPLLHLFRHRLARGPWLYPTEINSLSMRTKGAALGTATNWACNFMVVEITPIGIQTLHWRFYIIWTVFNAAFVPIVYLFYPETAGRTLEDIDRFFREDAKVLVFRDKDAISEKRPLKYVEHEQSEIRRNSSVVTANPEIVRKRLVSIAKADDEGGWSREEKL